MYRGPRTQTLRVHDLDRDQVPGERPQPLDHVGDGLCVLDDDLAASSSPWDASSSSPWDPVSPVGYPVSEELPVDGTGIGGPPADPDRGGGDVPGRGDGGTAAGDWKWILERRRE